MENHAIETLKWYLNDTDDKIQHLRSVIEQYENTIAENKRTIEVLLVQYAQTQDAIEVLERDIRTKV